VRWDLTSVLVTGEYPPEEQEAAYARVSYGYSSGQRKQVRYLQVTTDDGAVPIWDRPYDGKTADVATVIETMGALREHARCTDFVLIRPDRRQQAALGGQPPEPPGVAAGGGRLPGPAAADTGVGRSLSGHPA
jgi:hypothetical protein